MCQTSDYCRSITGRCLSVLAFSLLFLCFPPVSAAYGGSLLSPSPYVLSSYVLSLFLLSATSFLPVGYYRLPQWTVQSTAMDCIVYSSGLYSLQQWTVVYVRKKKLMLGE